MTRTGHHLFGAACGMAAGQALGWSTASTVGAAIVAAAAAVLPDIDQRHWWRRTLGQARALQHRRLTHWWGLPAVLVLLLPALTGPARWLFACALIGWVSHLAGDWVFGKRPPWQAGTGRGPGIPLAPWWAYHGLNLRCATQQRGRARRWSLEYVFWLMCVLALAGQGAAMAGVL